MANKANRFRLLKTRNDLLKTGLTLADLQAYYRHLYPVEQYRRPRTNFELYAAQEIRVREAMNARRPGYKKVTLKPKRIRAATLAFMEWKGIEIGMAA